MRSKTFLLKRIVVVAGLFLLSTSAVIAQCDPDNPLCEGDFDCDCDVDGSDATLFKSDFGRSEFNFPCRPCPAPAPAPKTGQTISYFPGDDGDLEKGVPWPNPRFTDNGDGTVTDNLTGLIWLKNANCFGRRMWDDALSDPLGLENGECGLTDGSSAGDWRLPNKKELISLTHDGYYSPALSNTAGTGQWSEGDPFTNVQISSYWSSTFLAYGFFPVDAWFVTMGAGFVFWEPVDTINYVWPVRGGQ